MIKQILKKYYLEIVAGLLSLILTGLGWHIFNLNDQFQKLKRTQQAVSHDLREEPSLAPFNPTKTTPTNTPSISPKPMVQASVAPQPTQNSEKRVENKTNETDDHQQTDQNFTNPNSASNDNTTLPKPEPKKTISLTVLINDQSEFKLKVDPDSNHCQVLEQALGQGKIESLNLKFHSSLNSAAVYQINGLGDPNQVWWTYQVNGQQPPYGCSQVQAKDEDQVKWIYLKTE